MEERTKKELADIKRELNALAASQQEMLKLLKASVVDNIVI